MKKVRVATFAELDPTKPAHGLVANVDLVIVRWPDEDQVSILYDDITTWKREMHHVSGIPYGGVSP